MMVGGADHRPPSSGSFSVLCCWLFAVSAASTQKDTIDVRGHEVSALYLRLNDPALITKNGQRTFDIADVVREPRRFEAVSFEFSEEDGLAVRWADRHDSTYSVAWLDEHVFEQPSRPASHLWNARFAGLVPRIPFGDDESLLRTSQALVRYGVAIVTGAPLGGALDVGGWLGVVRETNYGSTFDVVDKGGAATNLAYTTAAIRSHTDNPYRDPFPGAQILACVAQSGEGGRTQLVDGFAAAERLRDVDPGAFALLSRVPHPYEYASDADEGSEGVLLRASAPVISVDQGGAVVRVAFNDRSAGKLRLPPTELRAYYEAWAAFDGLVNSDEFLARLKLRPGETLVFDNARVMHGREAYTPGAPRHLVGTYIDMDAVRSRVAAAKRPAPNHPPLCPKRTRPNPTQERPKREEARPKREEAHPKREEASPKREEARPKREEARPKREEARPKREEARPKREEALLRHGRRFTPTRHHPNPTQ